MCVCVCQREDQSGRDNSSERKFATKRAKRQSKAKQKKKNRKKERKKEKFMWGRVLWGRVCECVRRDRQRERKKFSKFSTFFLFFNEFFFFFHFLLFSNTLSPTINQIISYTMAEEEVCLFSSIERESENGSYWLWIVMIWFDGLIIVFLFPLLYIYIFTCLLPSIQRIIMQPRFEIHFRKLMRWIHKIG